MAESAIVDQLNERYPLVIEACEEFILAWDTDESSGDAAARARGESLAALVTTTGHLDALLRELGA